MIFKKKGNKIETLNLLKNRTCNTCSNCRQTTSASTFSMEMITDMFCTVKNRIPDKLTCSDWTDPGASSVDYTFGRGIV